MLHLVFKDLRLQKRETLAFAVLLGIAGALSLKANPAFTVASVFMTVYMFVVYTNAFDYKYNAEAMLNSLPVGRSTIVAAKYASVFVMLVVALAATLVPAACLRMAGWLPTASMLDVTLLVFPLAALYCSIYYPLYFRLGYTRSRWASVGAIVTAMFIAGKMGGTNSLSMLSGRAGAAPVELGTPVLLGLSAAAMLLLCLSLVVSLGIYRRREF